MAPRWMIATGIVLVLCSVIPLVLVIRARHTVTANERIHLVLDMDDQPKRGPQSANPLFADGRAMRMPPAGVVARGDLSESEPVLTGRVGGEWLRSIPVPVTPALMARGRERYDIYCAPCHGLAGYGDGLVARRAGLTKQAAWTPPASLHDATLRDREDGHLYNTITAGIRSMPPYAGQISPRDRWAIVAYIRALQRSQNAGAADFPEGQRGGAK
jgi:mono/diheme cytochrome c family protein